jgi:hypothetical protein
MERFVPGSKMAFAGALISSLLEMQLTERVRLLELTMSPSLRPSEVSVLEVVSAESEKINAGSVR